MSERILSDTSSYVLSPQVARRRIDSYNRRFGKAHMYLAFHAAFPLALTPDLLYRLWANFPRDINDELLNIPWVAVADLLLSSLCEEVSPELYEMNITVRTTLLNDLKSDPRFSEQRVDELSDFLLAYVQRQLKSPDPDIRDFALTQQWTALAYSKPSEAAHRLALALRSKLEQNDKIEQLRIASLIETFAEPLADFTPLLVYARGITQFAHGEVDHVATQFIQVVGSEHSLQVLKVSLPIPQIILEKMKELPQPIDSIPKDFFISYYSSDRPWAEWINWQLEGAGYSAILQDWDFRSETDFARAIDKATKAAKHILVVLSNSYVKELTRQPDRVIVFAQNQIRKQDILLPVRVETCELKILLETIGYLDLIGLDELTTSERLLDGLRYWHPVPISGPTSFKGFKHSLAKRPRFPGVLSGKAESKGKIEPIDSLGPVIYSTAQKAVQTYTQGILTVERLVQKIFQELEALIDGKNEPSQQLLARIAQRICSHELYDASRSVEIDRRNYAFSNIRRFLEDSLRRSQYAISLEIGGATEDVIQETLIDLYKTLVERSVGPEDPKAFLKWIQTILIRWAYTTLQKQRRETHSSLDTKPFSIDEEFEDLIDEEFGDLIDEEFEDLIDTRNDPMEYILREELLEILSHAILSLTNPRYREVLIYTYLGGLDESELALHLQVRVQDIYLWRHRALKAIRSKPEVLDALRWYTEIT